MNNDFEITFIPYRDIYKINKKILDFNPSDFAKLLSYTTDKYWCNSIIQKDRTVKCVDKDGDPFSFFASTDDICIRPVIKYSEIEPFVPVGYNDLLNCSYAFFGEYPQALVSFDKNEELEQAFKNNLLNKTGKFYTTVGPTITPSGLHVRHKKFEPYEHIEYEYKGSKYIRVPRDFEGAFCAANTSFPYHDNIEDYEYFWVKVNPICWLIDSENDLAISENALLSGLRYQYDDDYDLAFKLTDMYKYLNTYFKNEIMTNKINLDIDYNKNDYNDIISKKFK